ncbi:MAG TPA: aldehyde dehydrogenase family protein [Abditibacterium sp.]
MPSFKPTFSAKDAETLWDDNNLTWKGFEVVGIPDHALSPWNGKVIQLAHVMTPADLHSLFAAPAPPAAWTESDIFAFAQRLFHAIQELEKALREAMRLETAFSASDCDELMEGTRHYLARFAEYYASATPTESLLQRYDCGSSEREIRLQPGAWGTVSVLLPQNALLFLAVVCVVNALVAGNRVVLRFPLQGARTAALLATAIVQAKPPRESVAVIVAKGREFLEAAYAGPHPNLIHYLGASEFGGDILKMAFEGGKPALIDGSGNGWIWVSDSTDPQHAAQLLTHGATRYNGQTCTSINGAVIHPAIYAQVRDLLQKQWQQLSRDATQEASIGPLFDAKQAAFCQERCQSSGGQILCGGHAQDNYLEPTLVENPRTDSDLVQNGVFGPVLWLRPGTEADFVALWPSNRYPLCAAVLDSGAEEQWWLSRLPNVARLVLNGDPSLEYIYEPWGGYPPSGANVVGLWHRKYQRTVSVDAPAY